MVIIHDHMEEVNELDNWLKDDFLPCNNPNTPLLTKEEVKLCTAIIRLIQQKKLNPRLLTGL